MEERLASNQTVPGSSPGKGPNSLEGWRAFRQKTFPCEKLLLRKQQLLSTSSLLNPETFGAWLTGKHLPFKQ